MHLRAIDWSNVAGGMREQRCRECISAKRLASTETAHVTYARGCGLWHRITHYLLSHVSDPLQLKPIDIDSHLFPVPFLSWTQILELWADIVFLVHSVRYDYLLCERYSMESRKWFLFSFFFFFTHSSYYYSDLHGYVMQGCLSACLYTHCTIYTICMYVWSVMLYFLSYLVYWCLSANQIALRGQ